MRKFWFKLFGETKIIFLFSKDIILFVSCSGNRKWDISDDFI